MPPAARHGAALCVAAIALAIALPACGGSGKDDHVDRVARGTLTIYSSLPHRGVSAGAARQVAAGERLALNDAGGRAGGRRVRLVSMDSTRPDGKTPWDPGAVNENADRASDDPHAVAYLGELGYGATAVSLPRTNDAGILEVSPGDGLTSLTVEPPQQPRAGPARYYPTDRRTFVRLVPNDLRLGTELVARMARDGLKTASIVSDRTIYGRELAEVVAVRARRAGVRVTGAHDFPRDLNHVQDTVDDVAKERPAAVVVTGVSDPTTPALLRALRRPLPGVPVYGGTGLAARALPGAMPGEVTVLAPVLPASEYPAEGRAVLARLRAREPAAAGPPALYGYAAMTVALRAIDAAGPGRRSRIVRAARTRRPRETVLGRFTVRRRGDVSTRRFGVYRLRGGVFRPVGTAPQG